MSDTTPPAMMPAAWYIDPNDASQERFWDGTGWTEQVRPVGAPTTAPDKVPAPPTTTSNVFSVVGIFFGVLSFLIYPVIFGPIGLILGGAAKLRGEAKSTTALVVAGIGMVGGMLIGLLVGILSA